MCIRERKHTSSEPTSKGQSATKSQRSAGQNEPGGGLRQLRSTQAFRIVNFELYARPVRMDTALML